MLCKAETKDPRLCIEEGKDVTKCAFEFFGKLKSFCDAEFRSHWQCYDQRGIDWGVAKYVSLSYPISLYPIYF